MTDVSPAALFFPLPMALGLLKCTFLHFECSADRLPQSGMQYLGTKLKGEFVYFNLSLIYVVFVNHLHKFSQSGGIDHM